MEKRHTIPAVDKSLKLLTVLAESDEAWSSARLARTLDISPSTCYRILQTLVGRNWLRLTPEGDYTFSAGMFPLLKPLTNYQRLFESLGAPLQRLVGETGLTAKLSVKQGDSASTVFRVESPRPLAPSFKVGGSFSLSYGSSGSCLLAGLEDGEITRILDESPADVWTYQSPDDVWARVGSVRSQGFCMDAGRYQPSVYSASAPIHNREERYFAALSLIGWEADFHGGKQKEIQALVLQYAAQCSEGLGDKAVA
ncbi:MAG: IclR family transcriptional regulator [Puniceicoccales bacterium]